MSSRKHSTIISNGIEKVMLTFSTRMEEVVMNANKVANQTVVMR